MTRIAANVILFSLCLPLAAEGGDRPVIVATIPPIAMILREIAGDEAEVRCLLAPGDSPHTYEPRPSDMRAVTGCAALFMAGPGLDDWAARLPATKIIKCMDLLPGEAIVRFGESDGGHEDHDHDHPHDEGEADPHFWTDPIVAGDAARGMLAELQKALPQADAPGLQNNLAAFLTKTVALDEAIRARLAPHKGRAVILFHPSFNYLLRRAGVRVAGVIEPAPGKEPSPRQLKNLRDVMRRERITTVFTEPQLAPGPARALAEAAGARLAMLDPNGGGPGRETYEKLIHHNLNALAESFQ